MPGQNSSDKKILRQRELANTLSRGKELNDEDKAMSDQEAKAFGKDMAADTISDEEYNEYFTLSSDKQREWREKMIKSIIDSNPNLNKDRKLYELLMDEDIRNCAGPKRLKQYFVFGYPDFLKSLKFEINGDVTNETIHTCILNQLTHKNYDYSGKWPSWLTRKSIYCEDDDHNAYKIKMLSEIMKTGSSFRDETGSSPYVIFDIAKKNNNQLLYKDLRAWFEKAIPELKQRKQDRDNKENNPTVKDKLLNYTKTDKIDLNTMVNYIKDLGTFNDSPEFIQGLENGQYKNELDNILRQKFVPSSFDEDEQQTLNDTITNGLKTLYDAVKTQKAKEDAEAQKIKDKQAADAAPHTVRDLIKQKLDVAKLTSDDIYNYVANLDYFKNRNQDIEIIKSSNADVNSALVKFLKQSADNYTDDVLGRDTYDALDTDLADAVYNALQKVYNSK